METKLTFTHVIPTVLIEAFGITDDTSTPISSMEQSTLNWNPKKTTAF